MNDFSLLISSWYRLNRRKLPWRETNDPYKIWLSEIILQQTRVDQGLNYYYKFVHNYPCVHDLADADEQEVLNDWQGLGYYSRARNLRQTARIISKELNGQFPDNYNDLIKLKGIGPYSAAAIASFSFAEKKAVVDGNVYRVLGRVFDISLPFDSVPGKKLFQELADELIPENDPATHNQAIMELGAMICTPKSPDCESCPLEGMCKSRMLGNILDRPVRSKRTKKRDRFFHYFVYHWDNKIILRKRTNKDIWQHLFEFPLIETNSVEYPEQASRSKHSSLLYKHVLSHQKIHAVFHHFDKPPTQTNEDWLIVQTETLGEYPVPRLIENYLSKIRS